MASSRKLAIKPPTAAPVRSPKSRRNDSDPFRVIEAYASALAPVAGPFFEAIAGVASQIQFASDTLHAENLTDCSVRTKRRRPLDDDLTDS